jgi:hypothetical protein
MKRLRWTTRLIIATSVGTFLLLQGCATHTYLISSESEKSNSDAVQMAQQQLVVAETKGCKAISVSGGPSVALGLVIGEACADCQPIQKNQRRQVYVVNVLMQCPGDGSVSSN